MAPARAQKNYRLSFGGTRAKKWAPTLKQAVKDARYWTAFGQMQVCIDQRLPSGSFRRIGCVKRRRR